MLYVSCFLYFPLHLYVWRFNIIGMAQKRSGRGLSSSAGLVTYYDADDKKALHIKPLAVIIAAAVIAVAVYVLNLIF